MCMGGVIMFVMIDYINDLDYLLEIVVQDDKEVGIFCCCCDIFMNVELYEFEMKYIFEGNWVYLVYESQIFDNNDYYMMWIGCQLIVIMCDKIGELYVVINVCVYKGVMLCCCKYGNKGSFMCLFYGWIFLNIGKLLKVKDEKMIEYLVQFNMYGLYDLKKVVCFVNYCGFLFGSFNVDVLLFEDYFGEVCVIIDQIVDQVLNGFEVLCGNLFYIYEGNWKMQMENGCDGYYVSIVYWNYVVMMGCCKVDGIKVVDVNSWSKLVVGVYGFDYGYILLWMQMMNLEVWFVYQYCDEIWVCVGDVQVDFIVNQMCNLCVYLNVFLMDQFSMQICVV